MKVGNKVRFVVPCRKHRKVHIKRMVGVISKIFDDCVMITCKGKVYRRDKHQVASTGAMS